MRRMHGLLATAGLSLVLGLYGCGGGGASEPAPTSDAEETPVEEIEEAQEPEEDTANTSIGDFEEIPLAGCDYHYELNEVSSFSGTRNDVQVQREAAISFDDDDHAMLLGTDGKPMLDGQAILGVEYFADGVYMYAADVDDVNNCGLVSLTDGMLIGPESAKIATKTDDPADARFLEVIYATEETDNEDECFIFATDALFALSPGEDDIMYKGYAKVYDLKNKQFVEGVQIDNASLTAMHDLGDAFVVEGNDGIFTMYDENGKELWSSDYYPDLGTNSLAYSHGGDYSIIDVSGKETFKTSDSLNTLTGTDDLYILTTPDKKYAINGSGGLVLKDAYENLYAEYHGMFVVSDGGTTKIVTSNGDVLADDVQDYTVNEAIPGILTYKNTNEKYALCFSDGRIVETGDYLGNTLDADDGDGNMLVLADGTFSLKLSSNDTLAKGLVKGCGNESMSTYGLYDLFTGKELLDSSYEKIDWAGGYIYAFKDGTWTVYEAKLVEG